MNTNKAVSLTLKIFVATGLTVMVAGLLMSESDIGENLLLAGTFILVCGPPAGIAVAYTSLIKERDWFWVKIATVLISILIAGMLLTVIR